MRGESITTRTRGVAVAACSAVAVASAVSASGAGNASLLRQHAADLGRTNAAAAVRARAAVLTLYALDSSLARAQSELAALRRQTETLERRRAQARRELAVARRLVRASQRNLASRLRAVYEHGDTDRLAIVIGASSLDDALSRIETVDAAAASDRRLVQRAVQARTSYFRLKARLGARAAKLRRLERASAARTRALGAARAERTAYVHQLARSRRLNTAQIGRLEAQARAIESQARQVALEQTAVAGSTPAAPAAAGGRTLTVLATAYTMRGRTATGAPAAYGIVAVDPSVIPLGTRMTVPGYGEAVAADTGTSVRGAAIDLWFASAAQAAAWGRRSVTISLH